MWIFFLSTSCIDHASVDASSEDLSYDAPIITDISWLCENNTWETIVHTTNWTANGFVWMASLDRIERHPLYSYDPANDGSVDVLHSNLSSVADWRDWSSGSYTGWFCSDQEEISIAIAVLHPQTRTYSNCRFIGNDIWEEYNIPDCTEWLPPSALE